MNVLYYFWLTYFNIFVLHFEEDRTLKIIEKIEESIDMLGNMRKSKETLHDNIKK